jgi:dsRNA-specific ribonuclease
MRKCVICEKTSHMERKRNLLRGHYNPSEKFRKFPNLQPVSIKGHKSVLVCTDCKKGIAQGKINLAKFVAIKKVAKTKARKSTKTK